MNYKIFFLISIISIIFLIAILYVITNGFILDSTLQSESEIIFVSDPSSFFKGDSNRDRVENGDLQYLLEAEKKLWDSNTLPIVSTYADGTLESVQIGMDSSIKNSMSKSEIASEIRDMVDVRVYVFFEDDSSDD